MIRAVLVAALTCLAGAAQAASPEPEAMVEPLRGVQTGGGSVTLRVNSNGCTDKRSFVFDARPTTAGVRLTVLRVRPDFCRALLRNGVALTWTYNELGAPAGVPIIVSNPIVTSRPPP